jgi:hypothetical protein
MHPLEIGCSVRQLSRRPSATPGAGWQLLRKNFVTNQKIVCAAGFIRYHIGELLHIDKTLPKTALKG